MVNRLFGKKLGMISYFLEDGRGVPVTVLKVGPCVVTQKKTRKREGYDALQLGCGTKKDSRVNKPLKGHLKSVGGRAFARLREVRVDDPDDFELGQEIKSDIFKIGELVNVRGRSKGRGFSGVMKRWGFSGGKKTHGSRSHRIPGSIGCSATPGKVQKGRKLPGRMGYQHVTIKNLKVVDVRPDMDLVLVKGAVPGGPDNLLEIWKSQAGV
ncbi:MAG: 50S ribosomal protein L3 [Deltaproteobacteria bacterium]|nr:50S ribosomal protein L3 [Deltaproteobacteria bacterium]MBW2048094.1 50S ribosomal protein L3 [Deltaproteobacteria bacterium]MBW2110478.1 50S ribosomal protein L3 [Deltaproteobacteria bacterium]MBW2352641.1 50S ribosomal protein L3 [Deltaproteobacteria bacterium]HDZ90841.1 50S ribosomal protein L3 [Deltaproteobacteria bacterium]